MPQTGRKLRILAVDDDGGLRELMAALLTALGHEVVSAADGVQGFQAFAATAFDLVLTDLRMPAMDGYQLASRIKALRPATPIGLVSASPEALTGAELRARGIDAFLAKPFGLAELRRLVDQMASAPVRAGTSAPAAQTADATPLSQAWERRVPVQRASG